MDTILNDFLRVQETEALELAAESDLVDVIPLGPEPHQRFLVCYSCTGLVRTRDGITEADQFEMGVYMPSDYLRRVNPCDVLTWLLPPNTFMPNISFPFVCAGRLTPGTSLVELIHQCFEIVTCQKVTMREDDALNPAACVWARNNLERLPIDDRPMVRRSGENRIKVSKRTEGE